jgi:PIN domain nuclease of toxin-antitoxin system
VNYVLDTHPFVWKLTGRDKKLGRQALRAVERAERGADHLHLSVASLLEIIQLIERDRLRLPYAWTELRSAIDRFPGLTLEEVTAEDMDHARSLAPLVDPFDRMIAGTALRLGVPLVTIDERIIDSRLVKTVW